MADSVSTGASATDQMSPRQVAEQIGVMRQVFELASEDLEAALAFAQQASMPVPPTIRHLLAERGNVAILSGALRQAVRLYSAEVEAPLAWRHFCYRMEALADPLRTFVSLWMAQPGHETDEVGACDFIMAVTDKSPNRPQVADEIEAAAARCIAASHRLAKAVREENRLADLAQAERAGNDQGRRDH